MAASAKKNLKENTMQGLIRALQDFWAKQGCVLLQPYDMPMGAGTFHPATAIELLRREKWKAAYVQGCRRPKDGRYGKNPLRLQHYYQFQVVLKPVEGGAQNLYLQSLKELGIDRRENDIRFVEDNWQSPTMGAFGIGWEVWLNGMEISQFTYMQKLGSIELSGKTIPVEMTYGLERIAMHLQGEQDVFNVKWDKNHTYRDLFFENEKQGSKFNFEECDRPRLTEVFKNSLAGGNKLADEGLYSPAWEQCLMASHSFNLLDAAAAFGPVEREGLIKDISRLAKNIAAKAAAGKG